MIFCENIISLDFSNKLELKMKERMSHSHVMAAKTFPMRFLLNAAI